MDDYKNRQAELKRRERIKKAKLRNRIIIVEFFIILILIIALIVVSINCISLKKQLGNAGTSFVSSTQSSATESINSGAQNSDIQSSTTQSVSTLSSTAQNSSTQSQATQSSQAQSDKVTLTKADLGQWYMKLVNPDVSVTNDFIRNVDVAQIKSKYTSGAESSKYLDSRIVDKFVEMCKAAEKDGVTLKAVSAYRSYSYQQTLYRNRVQRCMNEEGLSEADSKVKAATIVAVPGTSEHHLGLAVDINSVEESFENTKAFEWLQKNAENYGFIMRFPKDKQSITKIIYEPWHYRYVGIEHAKAINEKGMCLEEYIQYLSSID